LLNLYGGMRSDLDFLVFDPVHCYGLTGYLQIVEYLTAAGGHAGPSGAWRHLFCMHVVAALGLGEAEVNPLAFHPFSGLTDDTEIAGGYADLPKVPGIGLELNSGVRQALQAAFDH
jgi:L-alanine-DL-glutamate epimerase-like enolase superfamily enzyme